MPLFKGASGKASPGKMINYITDKEKAELVSSINLNDEKDYAKQFKETSKSFGKNQKYDERKYYHFKISIDPKDNCTYLDSHKFAEDMAKKLFSKYECVIATHKDTEVIHSHIVVNSINFEDGKKLHINDKDYVAMKDLANEMGKERGFSEMDFRKPTQEKVNYSLAEREIIKKGGESWKDDLRKVIDHEKENSISFEDFKNNLKEKYDVDVAERGTNITYRHPEHQKGVRGKKLGADYDLEGLKNYGFNRQIKRGKEQSRHDSIRTTDHTNREHTEGSRSGIAQKTLDGIDEQIREIERSVKQLTVEGREEQRAISKRNKKRVKNFTFESGRIEKQRRFISEKPQRDYDRVRKEVELQIKSKSIGHSR